MFIFFCVIIQWSTILARALIIVTSQIRSLKKLLTCFFNKSRRCVLVLGRFISHKLHLNEFIGCVLLLLNHTSIYLQLQVNFFTTVREKETRKLKVSWDLIEFSFSFIHIQNDINEAVSVWNTLQIRPTKNVNVPAGKPRILYCLPELNGTKDYSVEADQHVLQICRNQCLFDRNIPNDSDMHALINILMEENGLILPESVEEAQDLYVTLRLMANQEVHILQTCIYTLFNLFNGQHYERNCLLPLLSILQFIISK